MVEPLLSSDAVDAAFVPVAHSDVQGVEIDGELLLFDEQNGTWHLLNPAASIVWSILDGQGSIADLSNDIAEVFDTDAQSARDDVLEIVRNFGDLGLLSGVALKRQGSNPHGHVHGREVVSDDIGTPNPEDHIDNQQPAPVEDADHATPRYLEVPPSS